MELICVSLLIFIALREIWFSYSTNKLLNKLMSRDYQSYTQSEKKPEVHKVFLNQDPEEDLGPLDGFR